ncbi:MAG: ABC transporter ATP-binding protein [Rhizobiales bacterium]|nr:ABC transporter ATP-binding protein [Hyphomicrobiales bacterium]
MELDVEFVGVTKSFGDFVAVDNISFSVAKGSFFSLLGPSGCGKSTTLRMTSGFEHPDSGQLRIAGQEMAGVAPYRRPTNMVFQRWALFPHMTAAENVAFGLEVERTPRREMRERVAQALALVGLSEFSHRKPGQLSGGQMQRVALARALVKRPKVLLLDEPLGALDLKLRTQMQLELKRIQREVGTTFIYVTHDQGEAMTMSDHIAVMNKGRIEQIDTPQTIYDRPATRFVAGFIGNANIAPLEIESVAGREAKVRSGGLSFVISDVDGATPGKGHMALRYERIRLGAAAAQAPLRFKADVRDVIFAGSVVQYVLALADGPLELLAEQSHEGGGALLSRGDRVDVGWEPNAPRLFAGG